MRDQRHGMADGTRGDPCIIRRNGTPVPLPLGDKTAVAAGDRIVVGNNEKPAQCKFDLHPSVLSPAILFSPEIEFSDGDERNGQKSSLEMWFVLFCE